MGGAGMGEAVVTACSGPTTRRKRRSSPIVTRTTPASRTRRADA